MLKLGDVFGSPYIGVYCAASELHAILPETAEPRTIKDIERTLGVKAIVTSLAGATVVGSLAAMNSHGVILTNFADRRDRERFPKQLRIGIMEEKLNAAGNNILATDKAALVHPAASRSTVEMIRDVLDVEVLRRSVAGIDTVGSVCIATSKGVVCHPRSSEEDLKALCELFGVQAKIATLNYGTPYVGACAVANSKGAFVGSRSTPIELGRLDDGLCLY
ncbi:MAG TPA: translation initiation factor IF-6 [Thermoplasmata archaeon]|nr:translation initiation factor IF-6 [Thermoplasmata archaeon]